MITMIIIMIQMYRLAFDTTTMNDMAFAHLFGAAIIECCFEGFGFIAYKTWKDSK